MNYNATHSVIEERCVNSIEVIARALAADDGYDPDEPSSEGRPMWNHFVRPAAAVVDALVLAHGYVEFMSLST